MSDRTDEDRAAQIAKDLAYCVSSQARYQLALEIIRAVRAEEREECAKVADDVGAIDDDMASDPEDPWGSACSMVSGRIRARRT